jgi:dUTPase
MPFKAVQMVLRRNIHYLCEEVTQISDTARGVGGFGSTDQKK